MKFTMISALAAALTIASAAPTLNPSIAKASPGKPRFPGGDIALTVSTAGTELAGYLPTVFIGYTGEVLISKKKPEGFDQPVLTGWKGISYNNQDFGTYVHLTIYTDDSKPVVFTSTEGCPIPGTETYYFSSNNDDKLYYYSDFRTPLSMWKACLDRSGDYFVYWDSDNSLDKCIKIDVHFTDLSIKV